MVRQQAGSRSAWVGNRRAVGQVMGRQQAGSRTGDGSATGDGSPTGGQSDRRWVGNRVRQQAGSQAGRVREQGSATGG